VRGAGTREGIVTTYDQGYENGENSAHADWVFAFSEAMDLEIGETGPLVVAEAFAAVLTRDQVKEVQILLDAADDTE
jgi:hypothetical protein